jgi:hypothetical protein
MTCKHEPPPRPRTVEPRELGFTPQEKMVDWFSPTQLAKTGLHVALSAMFAAYSDKRELQGVLPADPAFPHDEHRELWIDFVADAGDGFNPAYTVAWLLADEKPAIANGGGDVPTRRGDLLVMGGDQV